MGIVPDAFQIFSLDKKIAKLKPDTMINIHLF